MTLDRSIRCVNDSIKSLNDRLYLISPFLIYRSQTYKNGEINIANIDLYTPIMI